MSNWRSQNNWVNPLYIYDYCVNTPLKIRNTCSGFRLPASHVIHTVGPVYDEDDQPQVSLTNSYRSVVVFIFKLFL